MTGNDGRRTQRHAAAQVERVLGSRVAQVLPPMAQLASLTLRLPRSTIIVLWYVARCEHCDVGEITHDELEGLIGRDAAERVEARLPGSRGVGLPVHDGRRSVLRRSGARRRRRHAPRVRNASVRPGHSTGAEDDPARA